MQDSLEAPAHPMSTSHRRSDPVLPKEPPPRIWSSESTSAVRVSAAWMTRPRAGESVSGDAVVVRPASGGVLIAVVDALGHGPKAAEVAAASTGYLEAASHDTISGFVDGLHEALEGTRGAAALLLHVSASGLEVCSVGNVELRSSNAKHPFVLSPGVLGVRLRKPKICSWAASGERFVLFSDGISGRFDLKALRTQPPADVASHIFATHRHKHDDATVVVVDVGA